MKRYWTFKNKQTNES